MEHLSVDLKISYLGAIYILRHIEGGGGQPNMTGGGGVRRIWRYIFLADFEDNLKKNHAVQEARKICSRKYCSTKQPEVPKGILWKSY